MNMHIIALAALFATLVVIPQNAQGQNSDANAEIVEYENKQGADGYEYSYKTSNGISAQEQASLRDAGSDQETIIVSGQYSYTGDDGAQRVVSYTADENGFQPHTN